MRTLVTEIEHALVEDELKNRHGR
jgi:hypothetical protein